MRAQAPPPSLRGLRVPDPALGTNRARRRQGPQAKKSLGADWSIRSWGRCHNVQTSRLVPLLSSQALSPGSIWALIDVGWSLREVRSRARVQVQERGLGEWGKRPTLTGQKSLFSSWSIERRNFTSTYTNNSRLIFVSSELVFIKNLELCLANKVRIMQAF